MKKKGEITAFLSLVFVLLLSFVLAMMESAQVQTAKNRKRLDVDRAVYSLFGEYQKELLEEYEVFALEGTYETGHFEEQKLVDRMAYYGSAGMDQTVSEIQLLTDQGGQPFREQILQFMETKTGLGLIQDLTGSAADWEEQKIEGEQAEERLEQIYSQGKEVLPDQSEDLQGLGQTGVLALVLPDEFVLSGKAVVQEQQLSKRERRTGRGSFPARTQTDGIREKLLFQQYVMEKMNYAMNLKSDSRNLEYEVEYLLNGKESDEANLKEVVKQILLVRFGVNYLYLQGDSEKQGEADTLAVTLATLALHPEAKELVKQLVLLLWAFGESTVDVRSLLAGSKVPKNKASSNWKLPIASVFTFWFSKPQYEKGEIEEGLDYGQYLQILLYLKNTDTITMRMLDRVEENLRFEKDLDFFAADQCITKMKLQNSIELWRGYTYSFPTYFGYL